MNTYSIVQADAIKFMDQLPADSVDLVVTSPPYERARKYGSVNFDLAGEEWVKWMVEVVTAASRVCTGLIAVVCDGQTKNYRWSAVPLLLAAHDE